MSRPLSRLQGKTEQANELARWMRRVTAGCTVAALKRDFPYQDKNVWTLYRNGSELIPEDLMEKVVEKYVLEPRQQGVKKTEGRRLLAEAQQAQRALDQGKPIPEPRRRGGEAEAWRRLAEAKQQQLDVERQLQASQDKCRNLENLVSHLQQRCVVLEQQRDRAREEMRAEFQRELKLARIYREEADTMLGHVRRTREEAHELRLDAERNVMHEQATIDEIETESDPGETELAPATVGSTAFAGLPSLDQLRTVIDAAGEQIAAQDQALDELSHMVRGTPAEASGAQPLPGEAIETPTEKPVVRGKTADNTETAGHDNTPLAPERRLGETAADEDQEENPTAPPTSPAPNEPAPDFSNAPCENPANQTSELRGLAFFGQRFDRLYAASCISSNSAWTSRGGRYPTAE